MNNFCCEPDQTGIVFEYVGRRIGLRFLRGLIIMRCVWLSGVVFAGRSVIRFEMAGDGIKVLTDLENAPTCVSIDMQVLTDLKRVPWRHGMRCGEPS